jgi:uncharacterized protein involved in response to NO
VDQSTVGNHIGGPRKRYRKDSRLPSVRLEVIDMDRHRFSLFAYGFRPFFLACGAYAVIAIGAWLWIYVSGVQMSASMPPFLWHAHEMLFGVIGAAIAGFLLTAVPSWTGSKGFAGWPLALMVLAWLAGRIGFAGNAIVPVPVLGASELIFLPMLMVFIAPPLLRARNRNTPLLIVVLALWVADAAYLLGIARFDASLALSSLHAGINIVLLLVTVIGGRIVPAFTASGLRGAQIEARMRTRPWLERAVIASMALIVIVDIAAPSSLASGVLAALAAIAQALRMSGWSALRTARLPIVWVLHVAYAWLPIGLALKAMFLLTDAWWAARWLHALTIGTAATMILAVMTRAILGHTGRPLSTSRPIVCAYGLLTLAAVVRVFGPIVASRDADLWIVAIAALLWIAAFVLFLVVYAPILIQPRADGRPG